ncbi:MAG TPA: molybdopterin-dependent oxidoreductase [Ramlibacter sp.]
MDILKTPTSRRRFVQAAGAAGAAAGAVQLNGLATLSHAQAPAPAKPESRTVVTKSICAQCPARCGIDVHTTDGRVHGIYGNPDHPIANGKLCPKGPLGLYVLYDPDRIKGPMKRTNAAKGRDQDPKFVPVSWDEALDTVAKRLNTLREKNEAHRFALLFGRGWGASEVGVPINSFAALYGSPNVGIGHSSLCSDGSVLAKQCTDGNASYSSYDYRNANYLLMFGANFLEAFRPYNNNMQVWGYIRGEKSPKTRVTAVDVHMNQTLSAADRALMVKPGTDGALALAIAHVILTEGLWERSFVGNFRDGANRFRAGEQVDPASFEEKWTHGLVEWWNAELKDRTPRWAASITTLAEKDIVATAREFGTTRPAIALFERGAHTHSNGVYNGMAIHSLNALVGSLYSEGGLAYQMGPAYGDMPVKEDAFKDALSKSAQPRIDLKGHPDGYPLAKNMMQEIPKNHLAGKPYKLDTVMFYMTNPVFSAPNATEWEKMLKDTFVIDTSPFPSETSVYADLVLPDHTYLERLQDAPTYPFQGFPLAQLRVPAVKPLYDTRYFGDTLIEIGKRMNSPMAGFYKAIDNTENIIRHLAKGFEKQPGDNGVDSFESWKEKGVWYRRPYHWRQVRGDFYEWDGKAYARAMSAEDVKAKLLKTPTGRFEFRSGYLEKNADYVAKNFGIAADRVGFPQWIEPKHTGGGDLHFVTPKNALHAEGRSANMPHAISLMQPAAGGKRQTVMEMHPATARARGIRDGDTVKVTSDLGSIRAVVRVTQLTRPDTVVLPFEHGHWAHGRWAKGRGSFVDSIIANQSDRISGMASYYTAKVKVERA